MEKIILPAYGDYPGNAWYVQSHGYGCYRSNVGKKDDAIKNMREPVSTVAELQAEENKKYDPNYTPREERVANRLAKIYNHIASKKDPLTESDITDMKRIIYQAEKVLKRFNQEYVTRTSSQ